MRLALATTLCLMAAPSFSEIVASEVRDEISGRTNYFAILRSEQGTDDQHITLGCLSDGTFAVETGGFGSDTIEFRIDDKPVASGGRLIWQYDPQSDFLDQLREGDRLVVKARGSLRSYSYLLAGAGDALTPIKEQCGR